MTFAPLRDATLIHGAAVSVMHDHLEDRSIDMVYSDPPFGTNQVWRGEAGSFDDRWRWNDDAQRGWSSLRELRGPGADVLWATCWSELHRAYLGVMADLLLEVHRVLKLTGSLWLHFDDTMGAHLRVLGDVVFGPRHFLGDVIWRRTNSHSNTNGFGRVHDTIACFRMSSATDFRLWRIGKFYGDPLSHDDPVRVGGYFEDQLNPSSNERVGYPTQKPVSLLEKLIEAATLPGSIVLDPTCGSGTTIIAALNTGRRAIGIDISADAIAVANKRVFGATRQGVLL